ncbi:hypothetical protein CUR178_05937 [Leishmania enriettii]|uniref:Uncharacterized protein n=1 Tax=Leishmania enriettii TaxID=5663 RepID=A0A836KS77_LEIEN|nr:hypothetical protein CUR178_05937 [Leishmania enriettii]
MASLLHRLRSFSPSPVHGSGKGDAGPADMFLVQVIAFGEVFAVPVCKATPVTVVLRHVMEAAVSEEQAMELGDVEATLYYKDKPLQLDTAMATVPRNAVLHLHSSVSTTSLMIHNHRHGAVSMLPPSRRRYANTTVTMHPCLRSKRVVVGGEGFDTPTSHRRSPGFGGLSSEGSPNAELHESPAAARLGSISEYASSACRDMERMSVPPPRDATPVVMWPPAMLPMTSPVPATTTAGIDVADMAPCYYFVPCAGVTTRTPIRLLSTQGRTVSAPSLTASRRRDSAVDFANSYHCPPVGVSPLDTAAIAAADPSSFSPLPSPPNMVAAAADRFTGSNDKYLVVYLRLPRDQAAACMSAAALNANRNIVVDAVEEDEVPVEEMLNATASTVATTKSCATGAYAYRSLRVQRDFPVGTLRELYAVTAEHRLHVAHAEVDDERKSFREMRVAPNTVFYFKRRIDAGGSAGMGQRGCQRSLTRERIREHIGATEAVPQPLATKDARSAATHHTPSRTAFARPSAGESFPSGPVPVFSGSTPSSRAHNRSRGIARSDTTSSTVSICERIGAFNESAVLNSTHGAEQAARVADGGAEAASATASTDRYVVEGHMLILSSAVAAEEARRAAELVALRAGVGAAGHQQQSPERERSAEDDNSPAAVSPREIGVSVADAEELCTGADCCLPNEAGEAIVTAATATRRASAPQADSVSRVFPETAASASAMDVAASHRQTKTYSLQCRSPTVEAAKREMRIDVLHGEEEETPKGVRTAASTQLPKARRMSVLVAKLQGLRGHRVNSTPVCALTPPHLASEEPLPLSVNDLVQPLIDVGAPLNPFATHADTDPPCPLHAVEEAADAKPKRMRPKGRRKKSAAGEKGVRSLKGTSAASRTASTGSSPAKNKRSNSAPLLQPLRRLSSRQRKADGATQSPSLDKDASTTPLAVASSLTPPTPEGLKALKHKSNRLSIRKRSEEAAETAAAAITALMPSSAKATARAAAEPAAAESAERSKTGVGDTPEQPKAAREAGSPSRGSGASYSQRHRRASASVPSQPVAFLGSDPGQGAIVTSLAAPIRVAEDISTTLEPAVLSSTRVPTPRDPPTPLSILVFPSRKQSGGRESNSRATGSCSSEQASPAASLRRSSVENCTTDYSVETLSSAHRLRITLRDPQDTTRFHYGVPVEPDCPIGALREWIAAMQRPSSEAGDAVLDLRDAKRYGIFLGDTFLPEADSVTFAEVTCGRNDTIFSIRSL